MKRITWPNILIAIGIFVFASAEILYRYMQASYMELRIVGILTAVIGFVWAQVSAKTQNKEYAKTPTPTPVKGVKTKEGEQFKYLALHFGLPMLLLGGGFWFAITSYFDFPVADIQTFYYALAAMGAGLFWMVLAFIHMHKSGVHFDNPSVKEFDKPKIPQWAQYMAFLLLLTYIWYGGKSNDSPYLWLFMIPVIIAMVWNSKNRTLKETS